MAISRLSLTRGEEDEVGRLRLRRDGDEWKGADVINCDNDEMVEDTEEKVVFQSGGGDIGMGDGVVWSTSVSLGSKVAGTLGANGLTFLAVCSRSMVSQISKATAASAAA